MTVQSIGGCHLSIPGDWDFRTSVEKDGIDGETVFSICSSKTGPMTIRRQSADLGAF